MNDCTSCKEDRKKKGLPPIERVCLPVAVTAAPHFRKPQLATYICPYCDGETLVSSALRTFKARKGA